MLAHGISIDQMVVRAGLATATAQRVVAGGRKREVATLRMTEAGPPDVWSIIVSIADDPYAERKKLTFEQAEGAGLC